MIMSYNVWKLNNLPKMLNELQRNDKYIYIEK